MERRRSTKRNFLAIAAGLALGAGGCSGETESPQDAEALDNALVGNANDADPAVTSALADQIMVDPTLTQQANGGSAKPTETPLQAPIPPDGPLPKGPAVSEKGLLKVPPPARTHGTGNPTLGELAKLQTNVQQGRANARCLQMLKYSIAWAQRVPAELPIYPQAQVSEAAGTDEGGCNIRIVSFATGAPLQNLLDWYYTRAIRGGYSAEHQIGQSDHVLAGTKGGSAYYLMARSRKDGGSEVDLVVSGGS